MINFLLSSLIFFLKCLLVFGAFGTLYFIFEVGFFIFNRPKILKPKRFLMLLIGGIIGSILFLVYKIPIFDNTIFIPLYMLISGIIITSGELGFGILLNIKLKLDLWDYSGFKYNFMGQINSEYAIKWCELGFVIYYLSMFLDWAVFHG